MDVTRGAGFCREGPRRHSHTGAAWVPAGPSGRKSQAVRGRSQRTPPHSDGTRKGWRRRSSRHLVINPPAIRVAQGAIPLGNRRKSMLEGKALKSTGHTWKASQPNREREFCTKKPRGLACQEIALFMDGKLGDPLQVQFDTDGERFLDFIQRRRKGRNVQVNADRFPSVIDAVRIALEIKGHIRLPASRMAKGNVTPQDTKGWRHLHGVATREPERNLCHTE